MPTIALRTADIQEQTTVFIPDQWQFIPGMKIRVDLSNSDSGVLEVMKQVRPNAWQLRWDRDASPLNGRTFELARLAQMTAPHMDDWECRLRLIEGSDA